MKIHMQGKYWKTKMTLVFIIIGMSGIVSKIFVEKLGKIGNQRKNRNNLAHPIIKSQSEHGKGAGVMEHRGEFLPRDLQLKTPVTTDKIA